MQPGSTRKWRKRVTMQISAMPSTTPGSRCRAESSVRRNRHCEYALVTESNPSIVSPLGSISDKPASPQNIPMKAIYPPITGSGRYCTYDASWRRPVMTSATPSRAVLRESEIKTVGNLSVNCVSDGNDGWCTT
jgi:hypothetical protein